MRRHRLMSREEHLLRETVRRIVAEAEVVPSDVSEYTEWLMSQGPVYSTGIDGSEGVLTFLGWLERFTDVAGWAANFLPPSWAGIAVNVGLDALSLMNSTVQWSISISNHQAALKHRSEFDPAKADEIIAAYEDARWWAFFNLCMTTAAYIASVLDYLEVPMAGWAEGVFKVAKYSLEIAAVVQFTLDMAEKGTDAALAAYKQVEPKINKILASKEVQETLSVITEAIDKNPRVVDALLTAIKVNSTTLQGMSVIKNELPGFNAWLEKKGYKQ